MGGEEKRDNHVYGSRVSSPTSKEWTYLNFIGTHLYFVISGDRKPT